MRKKIALIVLCVIFVMTGCGTNNSSAEPSSNTETSLSQSSTADNTEESKEEKSSEPSESVEKDNNKVNDVQTPEVSTPVPTPTPKPAPAPAPVQEQPVPSNNEQKNEPEEEYDYIPSETMPPEGLIEKNARIGLKLVQIDKYYCFIINEETEESITRWKYILNDKEVSEAEIKQAEEKANEEGKGYEVYTELHMGYSRINGRSNGWVMSVDRTYNLKIID